MKVSVIIPVFNEEASISGVLDRILDLDLAPLEIEVIVSNDGSSDGTAGRVAPYLEREKRIRMVSSEANVGKGSAVRKGLEAATGDLVLIQDADTEYSPEDYPKLIEPIVKGVTEVVYGSRFLERWWPRGMRLQNWLANRVFTLTVNLLYNGSISDEGTGYKVFRRELLEALALEATGFEFCAEATAKVLRRRVPIVEVPVAYQARGGKWAGAPGFLDGIRVLWTLVRLRFGGPPLSAE
jgi:glycosyltransferase involved in cell wall biosynthesis